MSIFDPSFHSAKKKIKPKQESAKSAPAPKIQSNDERSRSDEEIREIFSEMYKKHEELNIKIDKIYQLSGKDPKEVDEYFNDPTHFKPSEWERMQARKEEVEASITGLSKSDIKKRKVKKHVSKMSKDRKGKTLGARKNWLSMR